jgi:hypothetical protein
MQTFVYFLNADIGLYVDSRMQTLCYRVNLIPNQ